MAETGAIITSEARPDCARLAQSQVAPRCRLMATSLATKKKKKNRLGDSLAASLRNLQREVAAKHGEEEAGFGLWIATHIKMARLRGTWTVTPVGRQRFSCSTMQGADAPTAPQKRKDTRNWFDESCIQHWTCLHT